MLRSPTFVTLAAISAPQVVPSCLDHNTKVESPRLWSPAQLASIHVGFVDTRNPPSVPTETIRSIRRAAAPDEVVHFHAIVKYPFRDLPAAADVSVHHLVLPPHVKCVYDRLQRLATGLGREQETLHKAVLAWVVPLPRLLVMDGDMLVFRPLSLLWLEFEAFGFASVGAVEDTAVPYANFYKSSIPDQIRAFNGGVQLHNLERQRTGGYLATLDSIASGSEGLTIPLYGDQALFSLLNGVFPEHVYTLGCEWNRQVMGLRVLGHNSSIQSCPRQCAVLHANSKPVKCMTRLGGANHSCAAWRAALDRLARPGCPTSFIYGAGRHSLRTAALEHISDCCEGQTQRGGVGQGDSEHGRIGAHSPPVVLDLPASRATAGQGDAPWQLDTPTRYTSFANMHEGFETNGCGHRRHAAAVVRCVETRINRSWAAALGNVWHLNNSSIGGVTNRQIYLDLGANAPETSVLPFVYKYPRGEQFELVAFEADPTWLPSYRPPLCNTSCEGIKWVQAVVGLNDTISYFASHGLSVGRSASPTSDKVHTVPVTTVDLRRWLVENVRHEDFVVMKMDIERAEFAILPALLHEPSVLRLIDELFVECHHLETWDNGPHFRRECLTLYDKLQAAGVWTHDWY
jgi:FkbM family methyltransferase